MKFTSLDLPENILKAVAEKGYDTASPIQEKAIPPVLEGRDVMAAAQTGTGKTAGFTLPLLSLLAGGKKARPNEVRALILTPTRELAAQVQESVETYGKYMPLSSAVVFGGVKINPQMMRLRRGTDILVATPGRLLDLFNQRAVKFTQLEVLVLDEADRMLDMGFIHDIRKILNILPKRRQTLMFSATFSNDIRNLAKGIVNNPVEVSVTPENSTVDIIEQKIIPCDKSRKTSLITHLIKENDWQQVLIFSKTKHGANRLTRHLEKSGISAAAIHGNKSQGARTRALASFKALDVRVLVATDIAARGIDINQLPHVVNFDLPHVPEDYVHRIGRTGRAGAGGEAISLVTSEDFKLLADIERLIKKLIPRELIEGFEPVNKVRPSRLDSRGPKSHRPKRPKSNHEDGRRSGNNAQGGSSRRTGASQGTSQGRARSTSPSKGAGTGSAHGRTSSGGGTGSSAHGRVSR